MEMRYGWDGPSLNREMWDMDKQEVTAAKLKEGISLIIGMLFQSFFPT